MNIRYKEEAKVIDTNDRAEELIRLYMEKNGIEPIGYDSGAADGEMQGDWYEDALNTGEPTPGAETSEAPEANTSAGQIPGTTDEDYEYYFEDDDEWGIPKKRLKASAVERLTAQGILTAEGETAAVPAVETAEPGVSQDLGVNEEIPKKKAEAPAKKFESGLIKASKQNEEAEAAINEAKQNAEEIKSEAVLAGEEIIRHSEEAKKKIEEESAVIIAQAKDEVKRLMQQAVVDAEARKMEIFENAQKDGYAAGMEAAQAEINEKMQALEEQDARRLAEYEKQVQNLEPAFVNVVISLVQKLTGIEAEDNKEIIFHLLHQAMLNQTSSSSYIIRVSKSDYEFVSSKKDTIMSHMKKNAVVEIIEDHLLEKNQCLIETESRIIDCSLDVQLRNLIKDLRLLSGSEK